MAHREERREKRTERERKRGRDAEKEAMENGWDRVGCVVLPTAAKHVGTEFAYQPAKRTQGKQQCDVTARTAGRDRPPPDRGFPSKMNSLAALLHQVAADVINAASPILCRWRLWHLQPAPPTLSSRPFYGLKKSGGLRKESFFTLSVNPSFGGFRHQSRANLDYAAC